MPATTDLPHVYGLKIANGHVLYIQGWTEVLATVRRYRRGDPHFQPMSVRKVR